MAPVELVEQHRRDHRSDRPGGRAGGHRPGRLQRGGGRRPLPRRGRPRPARGGGRALRPHRPAARATCPGCRPTPTTSSTSPWPSPTSGRRTCGPTAVAWPTSWSTTALPGHSCTARPPGSTSPWGTTSSARTTRGRQPRRLAVPPDLQHRQDRGRGHRPVGGRPFRAADHRRPPVRPLRRRGGWPAIHLEMLRREPSPSTSTPRAPTIRSTRTTSSPWSPGCWPAGTPATVVNWGGRPGGQHRGVVRLPRRADRADADVRADRRDHRQCGDRPHPDPRAGRSHHRRLEGRHAPHGRVPPPRAAAGLTCRVSAGRHRFHGADDPRPSHRRARRPS